MSSVYHHTSTVESPVESTSGPTNSESHTDPSPPDPPHVSDPSTLHPEHLPPRMPESQFDTSTSAANSAYAANAAYHANSALPAPPSPPAHAYSAYHVNSAPSAPPAHANSAYHAYSAYSAPPAHAYSAYPYSNSPTGAGPPELATQSVDRRSHSLPAPVTSANPHPNSSAGASEPATPVKESPPDRNQRSISSILLTGFRQSLFNHGGTNDSTDPLSDIPTKPNMSVKERLGPTLKHAKQQRDLASTKAKRTTYYLNAAITVQVILGAFTTGVSASGAGHDGIATTILGGILTLAASYLARMRGSNEPEASLLLANDLSNFIRLCQAFVLDHGHVEIKDNNPIAFHQRLLDDIQQFRRTFEVVIGSTGGNPGAGAMRDAPARWDWLRRKEEPNVPTATAAGEDQRPHHQ